MNLAAALLMLVVGTSCSPAPAPVPVPRYGKVPDQRQGQGDMPAWYKAVQKQSLAPQYNSLQDERKIPAWLSPWPIQKPGNKRSPRRLERLPFRFRFYKTDDSELPYNLDKIEKRAEDRILGLNSVPMIGKRFLCQSQDCF